MKEFGSGLREGQAMPGWGWSQLTPQLSLCRGATLSRSVATDGKTYVILSTNNSVDGGEVMP